jgi:hypothetical protein
VDCSHPACGPQAPGGETVIVFDWAAASAESGAGYSEAAAEALVAGLVQWSQADPQLANLDHLHLIGHSRGAVVASEVSERLIAAGPPVPEQVLFDFSLEEGLVNGHSMTNPGRETIGVQIPLDRAGMHFPP